MALVWLPNVAFRNPGPHKGIYKQKTKKGKGTVCSQWVLCLSAELSQVSIGCVGWPSSLQLSPASDPAALITWGRAILGTPDQGRRGRYSVQWECVDPRTQSSSDPRGPSQLWEPHQVYSTVAVSNHWIQERKQSILLTLWTNLWPSPSSLWSSLGSFILNHLE